MRDALAVFGRRSAGFDRPDAVLTGVDTRTSAPLRTTSGTTRQSLNTPGLYPAAMALSLAG